MPKISGGYYIKARKIQESEIAHSPPHFREIWDWLLKECRHSDGKTHGREIKRGQCFTNYNEILDGLSWMVGYRKMRYSKTQCETAMKFLRSRLMITTTRTTRGMIITVINYNTYQNPKNYESHNENPNDTDSSPQQSHTINKNGKNEKKKETPLPPWLDVILWDEFKDHRKSIKAKMTPLTENKVILKLEKLKASGNDSSEVINQSIAMGWKGLFEVRGNNNGDPDQLCQECKTKPKIRNGLCKSCHEKKMNT